MFKFLFNKQVFVLILPSESFDDLFVPLNSTFYVHNSLKLIILNVKKENILLIILNLSAILAELVAFEPLVKLHHCYYMSGNYLLNNAHLDSSTNTFNPSTCVDNQHFFIFLGLDLSVLFK